MKNSILIILLFVCTNILLFAVAKNVESFTAKSDGLKINIEWRVSDEAEISAYELERSTETNPNFSRVTSMDTRGAGFLYRYTDEDVFMKGEKKSNGNEIQQKNSYTYRIKIIKSNGSFEYSDVAQVTHTVNSVKRTWGMLKEMFR